MAACRGDERVVSLVTQVCAQGATARKVVEQKLHLVCEYFARLQVNVFGVRRHERNGEQFHARLLGRLPRFAVVAVAASRNDIAPSVFAAKKDT